MESENENRVILLVDDDPVCNFICKKLIEQLGYQNDIEIATDGKSALNYLELAVKDKSKPLPCLILLDINMPVMNGWEFLEALEKFPKNLFHDIQIVMLTSSISPFDVEKADNNALVDGFNSKPVNVKSMASILEKHLLKG